MKEFKKMFDVIHVVCIERVEFSACQLKSVARTQYDQGKEGRDENAPHTNQACFEEALLGRLFPQELEEYNGSEFLTHKQDSLSVHEYKLKFTQLSLYAPEMAKDIRSRIHLFVVQLGRASSKEGWVGILIRDMDISSLMVYVEQLKKRS